VSTSTPPDTAPVCAAVARMLTNVTGRKFADSDAPLGVTDGEPYGVVMEIPGGYVEGDAAVTEGTTYLVVQISCVGYEPLQTRMLRDRADQAIRARTGRDFTNPIDDYELNGTTRSLTNQGAKVTDREFDSTSGVDHEGPVYNTAIRYRLWICPTA